MTGWEYINKIEAYLIINQNGWNGVENGRKLITKSIIDNTVAACFWTLEKSILGVQIIFTGPGEQKTYNFERFITASEAPKDVEEWQQKTITLLDGYPRYDNSDGFSMSYTEYRSETKVNNGKKFKFYVGYSKSSDSILITYDWQYKSKPEDSFTSINISSETYTISQEEATDSNCSTLEIHKYDSTTAGYYRCVASITEYYSGQANPSPDPHYKGNITIENAYCTLTII